MEGAFLLAQISDLHVVAPGRVLAPGLDTAAHVKAAVHQLNAFAPQPDLVLITGDLVDSGRPAEYAHLAELLAPLAAPFRLLPGNHDDAAALAAAFPDHIVGWRGGRCDGVIEGEPRLVCLDSSRGPEPGGHLDEAQLAWLDDVLAAAPDVDTLVALHHPPFPTGIAHMDAMALDAPSSAQLAEIVWRHPHVERVLCGHLHRVIVKRWAGTVAMTAPGVAHAIALDLRPGYAAWNMEPPAITLHLWRRGEGVITHVQDIGDFGRHDFANDEAS